MAIYTHNELVGGPGSAWFELIADSYATATTSLIVYEDGGGVETRLIGSFALNGSGFVTGGVISSMQRTNTGGVTIFETITGLAVSVGLFIGAATASGKMSLVLGGNDSLNGFSGNDLLRGFAGNDTFSGGLGSDTYFIEDAGDVVDEAFDAGYDTIHTTLNSYTLGNNLEFLKFAGSGNFDGTGNALDNQIVGGAGADTLNGGDGNDILSGGGGNDIYVGGDGDDFYFVDQVGDLVFEASGEGTDTVRTKLAEYTLSSIAEVEALYYAGPGGSTGTGNQFNNLMYGGAGNDILYGMAGHDIFVSEYGGEDKFHGGVGNDLFYVDSVGDVVIEIDGEGEDDEVFTALASYTLAANVEKLTFDGSGDFAGTGNAGANYIFGADGNDTVKGGGGDDSLYGHGGNDVLSGGNGADQIWGGYGNDTLDGGAGTDTLDGGPEGNDTYVLGAENDAVSDAGGTDTITSTISRSLAGYAAIENLALLGNAAINGTGNSLANVITGNGAANTLNGGTGIDSLVGGGGNDTYVTDGGDTIVEVVGGGSDIVFTTISFTLAAGQEIETFATSSQAGTGAINLTGNAFGQRINGNNGNNIIYGGAGNDVLIGYGGNDNIEGQAGADTLKGVSGADKFVFRQSLVATSGADHISDFGADDFIYFDVPSGPTGALDPAAFVAGAKALDANDRFIYYAPYKALYFDPDGNGAVAKVLFAVFDNGYVPTAADIILF